MPLAEDTLAHSNDLRVALATCAVLPEPDVDHSPLARALSARGCRIEKLAWDSAEDAPDVDICILRSTWNYYHQPGRFLQWIDDQAARSRLINPAPIVRWNADKRYLRELQQLGVDVVETIWSDQVGSRDELIEAVKQRGWPRFVLKPVVSAASFCTRVFSQREIPEAIGFLDEQPDSREMMAQPFMPSVETVGEKSIAWIDGELTHAWIKRPRFAGQHESVQVTDSLSVQDRAIVEQAVAPCRNDILYARIDLMYDEAGQPKLSELELIEPSLYFDFSPRGLARFADAIVRI